MTAECIFVMLRIDFFPEQLSIAGKAYFIILIVLEDDGGVIAPGLLTVFCMDIQIAGTEKDPGAGEQCLQFFLFRFRKVISMENFIEMTDPFSQQIDFCGPGSDPLQIGVTDIVQKILRQIKTEKDNDQAGNEK